MLKPRARRYAVSTLATGLVGGLVIASAASAGVTTKTSGTGQNLYASWTEYDPDNILGLPGNVHVGYLGFDSGPYGDYFYGNVTDFDCPAGVHPWGGHGVIIDDAAQIAENAIEDAINKVIDEGGTSIDGIAITEAIQEELSDKVPEAITEVFEEEGPVCEYIQDRFLERNESTKFTVDTAAKVARITGTISVTSGGHGEPGNLLATPPIDLTVTGGNWNKYESTYKGSGEGYKYSSWYQGTSYDGGVVTGAIGAMGFADDADDQSFVGFGSYKFKTVDRVR